MPSGGYFFADKAQHYSQLAPAGIQQISRKQLTVAKGKDCDSHTRFQVLPTRQGAIHICGPLAIHSLTGEGSHIQ